MNHLPKINLETIWERYQQQYIAACNKAQQKAIDIQPFKSIWLKSEFIAQHCIRNCQALPCLIRDTKKILKPNYAQKLNNILLKTENLHTLSSELRTFRNHEMVLIAWQDLAGKSTPKDTIEAVSRLAKAIVQEVMEKLYIWHCQENNIKPESHTPLMTLALGKLGGYELNFSSDIDVMFVYPDDVNTGSISALHFFTRLIQQFINLLSQTTYEGFVFRVDTRLRPFGQSGPLACTISSFKQYYEKHGRDWERYALIKANILTGGKQHQKQLSTFIQAFTYRYYVDYGMKSAIRQMKQMVIKEVKQKGMENHIKLGPGGIREIEFIVQSLQLIHGGTMKKLQERNCLQTLKQLQHKKLLTETQSDTLRKHYLYLRDLENKLQFYQDQQTHKLPESPLHQARIAFAMADENWPLCLETIKQCTHSVEAHFQSLIKLEDTTISPKEDKLPQAIDLNIKNERISDIAQDRLQQLIPLLKLESLSEKAQQAVNKLLHAIKKRSNYVMLLIENPSFIPEVIEAISHSLWVQSHLCQYPKLLTLFLPHDPFHQALETESLKAHIKTHLDEIPNEDTEAQMECLRDIRLKQMMRLALDEQKGLITAPEASTHLSLLAQTIVQSVEDLAWAEMITKFKIPKTHPFALDRAFMTIAYGKLGSHELNYDSDVDLVFLYDTPETDFIDLKQDFQSRQFYARLAQKILSLLQTRTYSGILYETDTRLRPSGSSGLLVSHFDAYAAYQHREAWTWEHQALVRARALSGPKVLQQKFTHLRSDILLIKRDETRLKQDVIEMREKQRTARLTHRKKIDLKQSSGGLVDIEFLTQFITLNFAYSTPELINSRCIIEIIQSSPNLSDLDKTFLTQAYQELLSALHEKTLGCIRQHKDIEIEMKNVQNLFSQYL